METNNIVGIPTEQMLRENRELYTLVTKAICDKLNGLDEFEDSVFTPEQLGDITYDRICTVYGQVLRNEVEHLEWFVRNYLTWRCCDCDNYYSNNIYSNTDHDGNVICQECRDDHYHTCESCGELFNMDEDAWCNGEDSMCESCFSERDGTAGERREQQELLRKYPIRHRQHSTNIIGNDCEGDTLKTTRIWSCEVEHYITDIKKAYESYKEMPDYFGLAHDGSLSSVGARAVDGKKYIGAYEMQTCLLRGSESEGLMRRVMQSFRTAGHKIDNTCGLHIHLDVNDLLQDENGLNGLKNLFAFHLVFEPIIQRFIPVRRRQNRFARVIANDYSLNTLSRLKTYQELEEFWYKVQGEDNVHSCRTTHYQETRYYGFNMHCLFQGHANVEIRHHSGTLNAQKILEWANLHARIIDYCKNADHKIGKFMKLKKLDTTELMDKFFELVGLTDESKAYFVGRHKKFGDKMPDLDEEQLEIPEKEIKVLPAESALRYQSPTTIMRSLDEVMTWTERGQLQVTPEEATLNPYIDAEDSFNLALGQTLRAVNEAQGTARGVGTVTEQNIINNNQNQ